MRIATTTRTHLGLAKDTLAPQLANRNVGGGNGPIPEVGGLHRRYERELA